MSIKSKLAIAAIGLSAMQPAFAATTDESQLLQVDSKGGFMYGTPGKDLYWFGVGGALQLDYAGFYGSDSDKGTYYHNGMNIRRAGFGFSGGIGHGWTYTFVMDISTDFNFGLSDYYATFHGVPNTRLNIGQVNPSFSLEGLFSSKWIPFMERSMASSAFGPSKGLGVSASTWGDWYLLQGSVTTPKKAATVWTSAARSSSFPINPSIDSNSDKPTFAARVNLVPYRQDNKVIQLGLAGHTTASNDYWVEFKTSPELQNRKGAVGVTPLNTTYFAGGTTPTRTVQAKNIAAYAVDINGQYDSLTAEAEYQQAIVKRPGSQTTLNFKGYHVQAAYILTGETRGYDITTGSFNKIVPQSKTGAWEVAVRHSFVNLNDDNVTGGSAHNTTFGVNYYPTPQVRVTGNYIRSTQHVNPLYGNQNRKLNMFGVRFQVFF